MLNKVNFTSQVRIHCDSLLCGMTWHRLNIQGIIHGLQDWLLGRGEFTRWWPKNFIRNIFQRHTKRSITYLPCTIFSFDSWFSGTCTCCSTCASAWNDVAFLFDVSWLGGSALAATIAMVWSFGGWKTFDEPIPKGLFLAFHALEFGFWACFGFLPLSTTFSTFWTGCSPRHEVML